MDECYNLVKGLEIPRVQEMADEFPRANMGIRTLIRQIINKLRNEFEFENASDAYTLLELYQDVFVGDYEPYNLLYPFYEEEEYQKEFEKNPTTILAKIKDALTKWNETRLAATNASIRF